MYDGGERRRGYAQRELDARYVLRAEYEMLEHRVSTMRALVDGVKDDTGKIKLYLVGGLNDEGKYAMGMLAYVKITTAVFGVGSSVLVAIMIAFITQHVR